MFGRWLGLAVRWESLGGEGADVRRKKKLNLFRFSEAVNSTNEVKQAETVTWKKKEARGRVRTEK